MNQGVDQVFETLDAMDLQYPQERNSVELPSEVSRLAKLLDSPSSLPSSLPYPKKWAASKMIEGDYKVTKAVKNALKEEKLKVVETFLSGHKEVANAIIRMRQQWIDAADDFVYVLVETDDFFRADTIRLIKKLAEDLEEHVPYVRDMKFLGNVEYVEGVEGGIEISDLIEEIPKTLEDMNLVREMAMNEPLYLDNLISGVEWGREIIEMVKWSSGKKLKMMGISLRLFVKGQNNFNKAMLMEVWAIINPIIHFTNRISKSLISSLNRISKSLISSLVANPSLRDSSIISTNSFAFWSSSPRSFKMG